MKTKIEKEVLKESPILFYTEEKFEKCKRCGTKVKVLKDSEHICISCSVKDYIKLTKQKTAQQIFDEMDEMIEKEGMLHPDDYRELKKKCGCK